MEVLYFLEGLRTPFLDAVMSALTHLGDETFFMALSLLLFWCVDKNRGYLVLSVGFVGTVINQFLKIAARVPRPWVLDGNFTIVESAREGAAGYSFPSGHTQNAVGTFGSLAVTSRPAWVRTLSVAALLAVSFSRLYLGVHTPADVAASFLIAAALVALMVPLFSYFRKNPGKMTAFFGALMVLAAAYLLYVELYPHPADIDAENLAAGRGNAYKLLGALTGICVAYPLELRHINFKTDAPLPAQTVKLLAGLGLTLALKSGLKAAFAATLGEAPFLDALRYAIIVLFAALLWPMTFGFWERIALKMKRKTERANE